MITISEAANFIKSYCLKDWDTDAIKYEIIKAINDNTLIYTVDNQDNLVGICIAHEDKEKKTLHVKAVVAKGNLLKTYLWYFKSRFSGYTLTAYRRGKFKQIKI